MRKRERETGGKGREIKIVTDKQTYSHIGRQTESETGPNRQTKTDRPTNEQTKSERETYSVCLERYRDSVLCPLSNAASDIVIL